MYYVTVKQSPAYHQMTLEEFLFGNDNSTSFVVNTNETNTRTYECYSVSDKFLGLFDVDELIKKLKEFNEATENLRSVERQSLYRTFFIPKKSGGLRQIDAPNDELSTALRRLKGIFENDFHALYHTSAFAYIKGRSTLDALKRHQSNDSHWFVKLDLHGFFNSTTFDFVMKMLSMVFPFSTVLEREDGKVELGKALDLCFLNGGLPQGTPISPTLTNIMMIPVDFNVNRKLRNEHGSFVYTRYADDFIISSKYQFDFTKIEKTIIDELAKYDSPFYLNEKKTRYGSRAGSNWNLGVMLNKDNELTIGYKNKRNFKCMLHNFICDCNNGIEWDIQDIKTMDGLRSYYRMVEAEKIDQMVQLINEKHGVDVVKMIKDRLRPQMN